MKNTYQNGSQRKFNHIRDRQINVRLSYIQMNALDKYCKERRITKSEFFRKIRMFVNSNTGSRPQYPVMTGETDRYKITDIIR